MFIKKAFILLIALMTLASFAQEDNFDKWETAEFEEMIENEIHYMMESAENKVHLINK